MSDWDGRVFKEDRFDDDRLYDQEFGKPAKHSLNNSSVQRSRSTRFKDTIEHDDGTETYLGTSLKKHKTMFESERSASSQSRSRTSPNKLKSELSPGKSSQAPKERKPKVQGKDLGVQVRDDLIFAAKMKLGTDLNKPKSIFQFWKNQVKDRKLKPKDLHSMGMALSKQNRSNAGSKKEIKPAEEPKSKKYKQLHTIYETYKHSSDADIWESLKVAYARDQRDKERIEEQKTAMMESSKEKQKEQLVRDEIQIHFKRYMDKRIIEKLGELNEKSREILEIRAKRAKNPKGHKKRDKSEKSRSKSKKRGPSRSPLRLDGSLDDISVSKFEDSKKLDGIEESISIKDKEKHKHKNKKVKEENEEKYTEEDIETFDYFIQRGLMEETHNLLAKLYAQLVFKSRAHHVKFTNDDQKLLVVWRDQKNEKLRGKYCKNLAKVYEKYDNMSKELKEANNENTEEINIFGAKKSKSKEKLEKKERNYLMEARDFIEQSIQSYFSSEKELIDMVVIQYEKDVAPELRSNDKLIEYYNETKENDKLKKGIFRPNGREIVKKHVEEANKKLTAAKLFEVFQEKKKEEAKNKLFEEIKKDFKNPEVKAKTLDELTKPKDKWRRGKKLMELQKKFPHDLILQRMVKEEFKENRLFKYPEEYEIYDDEEELKRKMPKYTMVNSVQLEEMEKDKQEKLKMTLEKFMYKEGASQQINKMRNEDRKHKLKLFNEDMKKEIEEYNRQAKNRLNEKQTKGQREMLAEIYTRLKTSHPETVTEKYKTKMYGIKPGSKAEKLWFPPEFKLEFYELYRKHVKKQRATSTRPAYFVPGGVNKDSKNRKIILGADLEKKKEKQTENTITRVWKRNDLIEDRKLIMTNNDDAINCTFEPNAGSQNVHLKKIMQTYPELEREDYQKERTLKDFVDKLGDKFSVSNPEIFKTGILRAATSHFNGGRLKEALSKLSEGFLFSSLKREYDPKFADELIAKRKKQNEELRKLKMSPEERQKYEAKQRKKKRKQEIALMTKNDKADRTKGGMKGAKSSKSPRPNKTLRKDITKSGGFNKNVPYEEKFPHQKTMKEEQFEKPKLKPVLDEAYQLLIRIEQEELRHKQNSMTLKGLVNKKKILLEQEIQRQKEEFVSYKQTKEKLKQEEEKKRKEQRDKEDERKRKLQIKKQKQEEENKK